jgi:hypothetical protein
MPEPFSGTWRGRASCDRRLRDAGRFGEIAFQLTHELHIAAMIEIAIDAALPAGIGKERATGR